MGDEFRKFHDNINHYGGNVILVAVTAPGADEGFPGIPTCVCSAAITATGAITAAELFVTSLASGTSRLRSVTRVCGRRHLWRRIGGSAGAVIEGRFLAEWRMLGPRNSAGSGTCTRLFPQGPHLSFSGRGLSCAS
jgi:hypothetical protein